MHIIFVRCILSIVYIIQRYFITVNDRSQERERETNDFYKYNSSCHLIPLFFQYKKMLVAKVGVRDHCKQIEIRSMLVEQRTRASDKRKARMKKKHSIQFTDCFTCSCGTEAPPHFNSNTKTELRFHLYVIYRTKQTRGVRRVFGWQGGYADRQAGGQTTTTQYACSRISWTTDAIVIYLVPRDYTHSKALAGSYYPNTYNVTHAQRGNEMKSSHHNNNKIMGMSLRLIMLFFFLLCSICFHLKCNYSSSCSNSIQWNHCHINHLFSVVKIVKNRCWLHLTVWHFYLEILKLFAKLPRTIVGVFFLYCIVAKQQRGGEKFTVTHTQRTYNVNVPYKLYSWCLMAKVIVRKKKIVLLTAENIHWLIYMMLKIDNCNLVEKI